MIVKEYLKTVPYLFYKYQIVTDSSWLGAPRLVVLNLMLFCCYNWYRLSPLFIVASTASYTRRKLQFLPDSHQTSTKMSKINLKFYWVLYTLILLNAVNGDSLTMDSKLHDMCSRSLSTLIFHICTGNIVISDLPAENLSKVRGKRASLFSRERIKRQVVDECCLRSCTVSQLIQYCPETWWEVDPFTMVLTDCSPCGLRQEIQWCKWFNPCVCVTIVLGFVAVLSV